MADVKKTLCEKRIPTKCVLGHVLSLCDFVIMINYVNTFLNPSNEDLLGT